MEKIDKSNILESIDLGGVKAVLMDLDNTFYEYDPCHKHALESSYVLINKFVPWSLEEFKFKYKEAQKIVKTRIPFQAASHSRLLYFQNLLEAEFGMTMPDMILKLEDAYWRSFMEKIVLKQEFISFTERCHLNGVKICVVSDLTARIQLEKIRHLSLGKQIDLLVTSEEAGIEKPEAAIFKIALEKLGVRPEETIMIGDHHERDKKGAEKIGIKAVLV